MEKHIRINRLAVSIFFFANGFLHANLMARLPKLQSTLAISNSRLGTLLFTIALGALVGMPLTGGLAQRFGSKQLAVVSGLLFCLFVPLVSMTESVWVCGILFFMMGITTGAMDVSMNGQAVVLERMWGKPIMSSFHAIFSIGLAAGAGAGAIFSKYAIDLKIHLWLMALLSILLLVWASSKLIVEKIEKKKERTGSIGFSFPNKAILPLGLIAFCCMTAEGSMTDWSAIYMHKVVGRDLAFSAVAFGVYASGMTLGRLFGDYTTAELGKRRLMMYNCFFAIAGLSLALFYVSFTSTLIGFFMVGIGVSTIVPIVFSTAGNTHGVNPSAGIAMATSIGYTGFFIGPPAIGYLADSYGLRIGLGFPLLLFVVMFVLIFRFIKSSSAS